MSTPTFRHVPPAAIEARGWGWRYATRRAWAVREATFRIEPGERVLVLGASGVGKSTLLQGMAGILGGADEGEQEGQLLVDGVPAASLRGRVGMVLQDPDSQTILARVGDDVAFGCENLGVAREQIWDRVAGALDAVGLDVSPDRPTSALSGGQKQRLALAGVVAMRPGAVLLDEPTANLDPAGVIEVRDAVRRVLDDTGATLVVIEHRVEVWLPLVDRVIVLGEDGVIADGRPEVVLSRDADALAARGVWLPGRSPLVLPPPAAAGDVLLSGESLTVARTPDRVAAGPLSVDVRAGEVLGVVGANGVGKSTLGLTLAGLLRPAGGVVRAAPELAAGAHLARTRARTRARTDDPLAWTSRSLLTRIGTVFQEPEHQLLARTVRAELEVGPRALGLSDADRQARVNELLERLRLAPLAEANPYTLSGGQKRRLTVGAMLATRPRVMVLDEPTFGQDARTWTEVVTMISELRDGIDERGPLAIVAISHDPEVLQALHARRVELTPAGVR